jgi:regulator of replication initiation timing
VTSFYALTTLSHFSLYEEKTRELEAFVDSHNKLKERWKTTVLDITEKLETKIKALQSENVALRKENVELLRLLSESSSSPS